MYCLKCAREFGKVKAYPCGLPSHDVPVAGLLTAEEVAIDAQRRLREKAHPLLEVAPPDAELPMKGENRIGQEEAFPISEAYQQKHARSFEKRRRPGG